MEVRAVRVAQSIAREPGGARNLDDICRGAGASRRTMERLFLLEAHMSLGEWRQQARLMHGLALLAAGETITRVALELGYSTPSAFISMFRHALGETPRRYFSGTDASRPAAPRVAQPRGRGSARSSRAHGE